MLKVGKFVGNHSMYAAIIKGGGQVRWGQDDERAGALRERMWMKEHSALKLYHEVVAC